MTFMHIETLEYFYKIAQGETFLAVADKYNISQSALSKAIKKLELDLGFSLLERNGRSVKLTQAGHRIMQDLSEMEFQYRHLKQHIRQFAANRCTSILLRLPGHILQLASILQLFQEMHPDILLTVGQNTRQHSDIQDTDANLVKDLDSYDMFVTRRPLQPSAMVPCDIIYEDALVAVMSNDHPLARKKQLCFSDLRTERICIGTWFRPFLEEAMRYADIQLEHIACLSYTRESYVWHLSNSRDIAVFFASDMYMIHSPDVCIRLLDDLPMWPIVLMHNKDPNMPGNHQLLRQHILNEVHSHPVRLKDYRNIIKNI